MREAVFCKEMKMLDSNTIENIGIPSCVLMERAALKTAEEMEKRFPKSKKEERILCVCGSGNNGGNGVAIARILKLHGYRAEIFPAGNPEHRTEETARQFSIAEKYQVPVVNNPGWDEYTTIVDALFGVGLARPVEGEYARLIGEMNRADAWKVAVDLPSGIDGDTGAVLGTAFRADLTVTFAFRKAGLCLYPGRKLAGRIEVADIGIYREESLMEGLRYLEDADLAAFPERDPDANKGTFGRVLMVAGSKGMCGAAYLGSAAALASGVGMVKILTHEANRIPLQTLLPEAMVDCGETEEDWEKAFGWCDVLVIGSGLGLSELSRKKARWFLEHAAGEKKPVVLDADGLNILAQENGLRDLVGAHVVLTPHMGEAARLTGRTIGELKTDRTASAWNLARDLGAVCVLKDSCTVTAGPEGEIWYNLSGNPGMAAAGSGDVLAGVIAGMLCLERTADGQGTANSHTRAAALGAYLHGRAGDLAAAEKGMYGMKAGDIIPAVANVIQHRGNHEKI